MRSRNPPRIRRRRPRPSSASAADINEQLAARIEELELRLKLLEARMRRVAVVERSRPKAAPKARGAEREVVRCPGCLLELPRSKHKDSCVWCGFRFEGLALNQ